MALAVVVCGVVAATAATSGVQAAPATPSPGAPLVAQDEPLDRDGYEVRGKGSVEPAFNSAPPPAPVWPAAGAAKVTLTAPASGPSGARAAKSPPGKSVRAGKLPVWVAPLAGQRSAEVAVEVLDRATVPERWREGLVVKVGRADAPATPADRAAAAHTSANVSVGYDTFRYAVGGDWASRLKLWQLPPCAMTTPDQPACAPTVLASANDTAAGKVTAAVRLTAAASGTIVALAATASGPDGDYAATSLGESSTWSVNGGFSWSYPMRVPPSAGGPEPEISLSYSSTSVDGRSAATNNQPSWIGEGFEYSPGFIERKYISCAEDMEGSHNNSVKTGDQCWRSDNATLSLDGRSTELIRDSDGNWHGRSEDGSVIKKVADADTANGDNDGEYWQVTTTDGTQYFFGRNKLPGQSATTESAWTTRVYGNHKNEPCNDTAGTSDFAKSGCDQAWRWNLDYVVDVRGNTMSYWYNKETNRYAANMKQTEPVQYVRGGTLRRIEYGTWDRASGRSVTARGQVDFTVKDRCKESCDKHTAANWPDVPWDQECKPAATTCDDVSPSYWSTYRLANVTTKVWDTSVTPQKWQEVDSWTLTPDFPSPTDGTHAGLWLASLQHTGLVGTPKALPPVTFSPTPLPNRVLGRHNRTDSWQRMGSIKTETGAKTVVTYSRPECTEANTDGLAAEHNTMLCYPVIAPNPSDPAEPDVTEWWHKYVVKQVAQVDVELADSHQSPTRNTYYKYLGKPAWHYTDDDGFTRKNRKTWSSYRGYQSVETRVGDPSGPQTLKVTKFLRGMHGDRLAPSGGSRNAPVDASLGDEVVYDEDQFAGMVREQTVYNGSDDKPVSTTVNVPWRSTAKASRTINGDVAEARFVDTRVTYSGTALGVNGSRGWRTTRTESTFNDADGTVAKTQDDGDRAKRDDEQCVTYRYNNNPGRNLIGLPEQVTVKAVPCSKDVAGTDDIISDTRYSYDGAADHTTSPVYGAVTRTERLKNWTTARGTEFQKIGEATFDDFGRTITQTDIRGATTTTTYEPATLPVAKVTSVTARPYAWKSSISQAPYWGLPTSTTDIIGGVATAEYDGLGRTSKVWALGWSKRGREATPSKSFEYNYPPARNAYPSVVSTVLNAAGTYNVGYAIYDGFLRPRQTQTRATDGNRVVTDTLYDEYGNATTTYSAHAEPGVPSGNLWWEPEWSLRHVERAQFDNAGRQTEQQTLTGDGETNLVKRWSTTTRHEGDLTRVTPPAGAVPTSTLTDAQGRVRELRLHTTAAGVDGTFDVTASTYNRKGQLVETEDPGGNKWSTKYDVVGRAERQVDPDKGTTELTYNDFDDLITSTDARGVMLLNEYDDLGRRTALYEGPKADGKLRAEWKYDRLYNRQPFAGQLTEAIRYDNKQAFKEQINSFDVRHLPLSINYVVPDTETGLGGVYQVAYGHSVFDGTLNSITYPAAGGLPTEEVTTRFDPATGLPLKLDSSWSYVTSYVTKQEYTKLGEPTVTFRKVNGGQYVQSAVEYDLFTRRVERQTVKPELATGTVADRRYTYDDAGNVLSLLDTPAVGEREKQCFGYDKLRRLVSAWTPKTDADCKVAPSLDALAGPAPYWTDWTIDKLGNRRTQTSHAQTGNTVQRYAYPDPGENVVRPHAVTGLTTSLNGTDVTVAFGYDRTGNLTDRPTGAGKQTLGWDAEGKLATTQDGDNTTSNLYSANGERLLRRDPSGTTLYLPGMEIKRPKGATDNTATRYYSFAGSMIASRTASTGLDWLFTDHQGTQLTSVNAVTQKVTTRRQSPYGEPRGPQPPSWVNSTGFVGGTIEPTGLTHLGARDYDPALGRFISVDPLLDMSDPQQWNGYAYAHNSPITSSDPSGLIPMCGNTAADCDNTPRLGSGKKAGNRNGGTSEVDAEGNQSSHGPCTNDAACERHRKHIDDARRRDTWNRYGPQNRECQAASGACAIARSNLDSGMPPELVIASMNCGYYSAGYNFSLGKCMQEQGYFQGWVDPQVAQVMVGAGITGKLGGGVNGAASSIIRSAKSCHSFDPDTPVLLDAEGNTKAISDIERGDEVMATDPETGETGPRKVLDTHTNNDTGLTDLVVKAEGGPEVVLHTTGGHRFWSQDRHDWIKAAELRDGERLQAYDGTDVVVEAVKPQPGAKIMRDLTVTHIATYYVMAGKTPILVHNCGEGVQAGVKNLKDGAHMATSDAMDTAAEFVGPGYRDMGGGRFLSADGLRQVRLTDADLAHPRQNPHINFETYNNPIGPGIRGGSPVSNIHIYLPEEPGWHLP